MATKPSDLLSRLPSASELLDKPPIRALANRWNRSVVAAGVRSFLDELRTDLERRAADVQLPSLRELAERAARRVIQLQQPSVRPGINATGRFFGPDWLATPVPDDALECFASLGGSFVLREQAPKHGNPAATLCRLTGADAAAVVSSYAGAAWLTLAAIAAQQEVIVSRAEVGDLERGCSLLSVAQAASVVLREVGGVNRVSAADYEVAVTERSAALLRHNPDDYRVVGKMEAVEVEALVGLARDRELPLVELVGAAPLVDDMPALGDAIPSVAASIAAGAHAVIVRGDGLVGGPRCGIIVGTREVIRRVEVHPMFAAWQADPSTTAALEATLELYGNPQQLQQSLPLYQLLSASVENLLQRAERLAPQIAQAEDVAAAEAIPMENCLGIARAADQPLPSYGIALTARDGDVLALHHRLCSAFVPVVGRLQDERLLLDLRTVFPRQDQRLVETIVGQWPANAGSGATSAASSEPAGEVERS